MCSKGFWHVLCSAIAWWFWIHNIVPVTHTYSHWKFQHGWPLNLNYTDRILHNQRFCLILSPIKPHLRSGILHVWQQNIIMHAQKHTYVILKLKNPKHAFLISVVTIIIWARDHFQESPCHCWSGLPGARKNVMFAYTRYTTMTLCQARTHLRLL